MGRSGPRRLADQRLHAAGEDPGRLLDGSPESLTPLWLWVRDRLADRAEPRRQAEGPSWLRYEGGGPERLLSDDSIDLADGLTSYLCRVVERGAPDAKWRVATTGCGATGEQNHPVLAHGNVEFALGACVGPRARRHVRGSRPELQPTGLPPVQQPEDDNLTILARSLITKLGGQAVPAPLVDEPLVEVSVCDDGTWELSVQEQIAAEHRLVDDLVARLQRDPRVDEALREDRERILVRAPSWSSDRLEGSDRLEDWATAFLHSRLGDG